MEKKIEILHLEDSENDSELIHSIIENAGIAHKYYLTDNEEDFANILEQENVDLILSDYSLPDYGGNEALMVAREKYPHLPFIFVTGTMGEDVAIDAMLNGATDYVLKNRLERLVPAIKRAMQEQNSTRERAIAEKALIENEKKCRNYIDCAPDIVFIIDNTGRFIDINPTACRISGYSKEELEAMTILDLLSEESKEGGLATLSLLLESGVCTTEVWTIGKDGSKRYLTLDAVKLSETRLLGFSKDITERKQAEEALIVANKELVYQNLEKEKRADELLIANKELAFQNQEKEKRATELVIANTELLFQNKEKEKRATELMRAREKAEESDKLKSAFLNNLSHEIRTPMNQILGFASFLKDPELTEMTRDEYINIINDQSHQLLHIIGDIVEISEISTGQADLKPATFNLGVMMDELYATFKPKAELRKLQLSLNKNIPDNEIVICGDHVKLRHIFSHLIENAIKFTDAGSVNIEYSRDGDNLIVAVKDTGIGIEEQEKNLIFDKFRQIEVTMARKYGGLGLGLSISNAYIRMMAGMIKVESKPGEGSTFIVVIPYVPATLVPDRTENEMKTPVFLRPDWKDKTLLIAEDEESNVLFLKAVLRSTGINLLYAVNGLEAVEQCKQHPEISVVLMDIKMPRMDGMDATKIIKSFRADLPVIATTAFALTSEKKFILGAGCDDYLPKPLKREDLISMIRKYMVN